MIERNQPRTPLDLRAIERALLQRLQARRTGEHTWEVSSSSQPGRWYSLHADEHGIDCDCPAGQTGRGCKHATLVQLLVAGGAVPAPKSPRRDPRGTVMLGHERRIGRHFQSDDPDDRPV